MALPTGAIAGELLGLLFRLIAAQLSSEPLSPPASVLAESARFAGLTGITLIAASLITAALQRDRSVRELLQRRPSQRVVLVGRLLGVALAIGGIVFIVPGVQPGDNTSSISILAAIAVCLLVPDLLVALRRASAGRGVRWRLVSNRLIIDRGKSCAVCAALIGCVGPFVALSAENAANASAQRATWDYQIPPGQVAIGKTPGGRIDRVDTDGVKVVERVTHQRPLQIAQLTAGTDTYSDPAIAVVAPEGRAPELQPSLLGVPSVTALRELLGKNLTRHAEVVVAEGGVLHFGAAPSRAPIGLSHDQNDGTSLATVTSAIPVAAIPSDHAWELQGSGFVLDSTARRLHLPLHVHLAVFNHISSAQTRTISSALRAAGVPIQALIQPRPFELIPEPAGLIYGRYGMLLLLAVLMTIALGSTARSLQKESRSLVAIGLRGSWARTALALQCAALTIIGLLGGLAVGAVSIVLYSLRLEGEPVVVPINELAILTAGSIVIAGTTGWLASRRLAPRKSSQA
jgi:hypothetical protein